MQRWTKQVSLETSSGRNKFRTKQVEVAGVWSTRTDAYSPVVMTRGPGTPLAALTRAGSSKRIFGCCRLFPGPSNHQ
jgi:hypothetical protein